MEFTSVQQICDFLPPDLGLVSQQTMLTQVPLKSSFLLLFSNPIILVGLCSAFQDVLSDSLT